MQAKEMLICHREQLKGLSEVELLAHLIWAEAGGEKVLGKLAVAHVVMNRVKAMSHYGGTIQEVILKPGQFSCFNGSDRSPSQVLKFSPSDREFAFCRAIAELASRGHLKDDPTGGATHFHRVDAKPPWASRLTLLRQIGNHVFYREPLNLSLGDRGLQPPRRSKRLSL